MTIDIENEALLTLGQACRILPSKPSPATLWRWRTRGVLIRDKRFKLECVRVGRKWYTTASAFADFLQRQTNATIPEEHSGTENHEAGTEPAALDFRLRNAGLLK